MQRPGVTRLQRAHLSGLLGRFKRLQESPEWPAGRACEVRLGRERLAHLVAIAHLVVCCGERRPLLQGLVLLDGSDEVLRVVLVREVRWSCPSLWWIPCTEAGALRGHPPPGIALLPRRVQGEEWRNHFGLRAAHEDALDKGREGVGICLPRTSFASSRPWRVASRATCRATRRGSRVCHR